MQVHEGLGLIFLGPNQSFDKEEMEREWEIIHMPLVQVLSNCSISLPALLH